MLSEFVIQGKTAGGVSFRPEDWAERLCGSLDKTGVDGRKAYSSYVRPVVIDGENSMVVRTSLQRKNPEVFNMIKRYIADNHLMVRPGRGSEYLQTTGAYPAIDREERRDQSNNNW
jgi:Protein of unknown function (DUF3579)